jgi:hypothetical protein
MTQAEHGRQTLGAAAGRTAAEIAGNLAKERMEAKSRERIKGMELAAKTNEDKLALQETKAAYQMWSDWRKSDQAKKLDNYETSRNANPERFDKGPLKADYDRLKTEERKIRETAASAYKRSNLPVPSDLESGAPSGATTVNAGGKTFTFPDAKSAEEFKKAAGIK